jgi:hypothetical protein
MRDEGISADRLSEAIARAEKGLIDADLGGGLIKQRVSRAGGGRSGGYRTLIAYQTVRRSVFVYGFAKSERDNINARRLAELKLLAKRFLNLTDAEIAKLLDVYDLKEIGYEQNSN